MHYFALFHVVIRAELRTVQTRRLANQSLGCIAKSRGSHFVYNMKKKKKNVYLAK